MSATVDQRIVQMQFDNAQFESGVQTSLGTLDKLKNALNFSGMQNGLETLQNESNNFNFNGIGNAVSGVMDKFSAFEIIALTTLTNITNKAVDAGVRLAKSLSIDQVTAGWTKFNEKTASMQTIMSATGLSVDEVNKYLEKLIWFTDETSYSFTDMTSNIGKFTSVGVSLEDSVTAMEGISTWAAKSGRGIGEASRAMYNLSQAMAVGSVKLMDWKSIENANMATSEFKQTVIDTAVKLGTLIKTQDGYVTANGKAKVSVQNFNSELSRGWFSKDVLLETLKIYGQYADGVYALSGEYDTCAEAMEAFNKQMDNTDPYMKQSKSAFEAAQVAKTFADAINATKDAVSSGWMQTFELIFGNIEEAKVFFTDLSGVLWDLFASSSEARNSLLATWHDAGSGQDLSGYAAFTGSILNILEAIVQVLKPIKSGLSDIFIGTGADAIEKFGKKLAILTGNFYDFTKRLKEAFTPVTVKDLREELNQLEFTRDRIMRGLKNGFIYDGYEQTGNDLEKINKQIDYLEGKISGMSKVEERVMNIRKTVSGLAAALDILRQGFKFVADIALTFVKALLPVGDTMLQITGSIGDWLVSLDNFIKESGFFENTLQRITPIIEKFADIVQKGFNFARDSIKKFLKFLSPVKDGLNDLADVGIKLDPFGKILEFLAKVFNKLKDALAAVKPLLANLKEYFTTALLNTFEGLKDMLTNFDMSKVTSIMNTGIFATLGIGLAKVFKGALGFLKSGKSVNVSLNDISTKISDVLSTIKEAVASYGQNTIDDLKALATAIGILTASLILLSTIDSEKLVVATGAIAGLMYALVTATKSLSGINFAKNDSSGGGLFGFIGGFLGFFGKGKGGSSMTTVGITVATFSSAILILAGALKVISSIDSSKLGTSMAAITTLMIEVVAMATVLSKNGGTITKGASSMLAFSAAISILASAVKKMGDLNYEQIKKGLIAISALILEFGLFFNHTDLNGIGASKGAGMVGMATSLLIMYEAIKKLGELDTDILVKGGAAITGLLAIVTGFSYMMSKTTSAIASAGALVIIANSLLLLIPTFKILGAMDMENIARALLAIGGALAEFVIALKLAKGTAGAAASLTIMAGAIMLLVPSLELLGHMKIGDIGKSLLALGGALTILGVAGYALGPIAGQILALSGALALFGVGIAGVGAGILSISLAFSTLVATFSYGPAVIISGLTAILQAIINVIPTLAATIGNAIVIIITTISNRAVSIIKAVVDIGKAILEGINELLPELEDTVSNILDAALKIIEEYIPKLVDLGVNLVLALIEGLDKKIDALVNAAGDLVIHFLNALGRKVPEIVNAGFQMIISLLNGMATAIRNNGPALGEALGNIVVAAIQSCLGFITNFLDVGKQYVTSIGEGMVNNVTGFMNKAKETVTKAVNAVKGFVSDFWNLGKSFIEGLSGGLNDTSANNKVVDSSIGAAKRAYKAVKNNWQVKSPSKRSAYLARMFIEGIATTFENDHGRIENAAEDLADNGFNSISSVVEDLMSRFDDDVAIKPVITPVLDMDAVRDEANSLGHIFGTGSLSANLTSQITSKWGKNSSISSTINDLSTKLDNLAYAVTNMKIVMDSGTLVGQIVDPMDQALGKRVSYTERGNRR